MEWMKDWFDGFFKPSRFKRVVFFLLCDSVLILCSLYLSVLIRFEFVFSPDYRTRFWSWALLLILTRIASMASWGLYHINWRFVGILDLKNVIKSFLVAGLFIFSLNHGLGMLKSPWFMSRGVLIIELLLSFLFISMLRIGKRLFYTFMRGEAGKPTLIIGANSLGDRLIMEMLRDKAMALYPVAILDRNESRSKTRIHGIPVFSGYQQIEGVIEQYRVKTVLINLKPDERKEIKDLFKRIHASGVGDVRVAPGVEEMNDELFRVRGFKQLSIEDLLTREAVQIDMEGVRTFIAGKVVLVTGAAGSIGSEVVRKLIEFGAGTVIAYEIDETELFFLNNEVKKMALDKIRFVPVLGDIRDVTKLEQTFECHKPAVVFHASAYKHVPILEDFPEEAIKTNVQGTFNLVQCALRYRCDKVINISTDKAVNPSSVMGASKRLAERVCRAHNCRDTRFVSVRFGNVLGSRGSVIPVFLDQIKRGGPVTVTHPEMKRYFMSIPEAVLLVFQAACMGTGGEVFVLDMGEPVCIMDLANNIIRMNGFTPGRDIEIICTGVRPGEKLFEELLTAEEGVNRTAHEKICIARQFEEIPVQEISAMIAEFLKVSQDSGQTLALIKRLVRFYDAPDFPPK